MGFQLGSAADSASAQQLLLEGRHHDLSCRSAEAIECYAAVLDLTGEPRLRAEALRRLGVLHHLRAEPEIARELCERSCEVAVQAGADDLAADASNALAGFALERGDLAEAQERYNQALSLAADNPALVGKIEQNLGIVANIRGQWAEALEHYSRSLAAYEASADRRGCAFAHHNLGMIHADQKRWAEADLHYQTSQALAAAAGDRHLGGIALMNRAEVRLAQGDWEGARAGAEQALAIFIEVEARRHRAGAHRLLGMVFRQGGQFALAESHLRSALEIAASACCPLIEADAARELATLYETEGRREDAIGLLTLARELYIRLRAQHDLGEIEGKIEAIQAA
ncbi:MAG: tetratricopeptide repeat protein [Gemmatimonadales bacterium]